MTGAGLALVVGLAAEIVAVWFILRANKQTAVRWAALGAVAIAFWAVVFLTTPLSD